MDLPAAYTPSWQPSPLSSQRWWSQPSVPPTTRFGESLISHHLDTGLSPLGAYSSFASPAPAPLPPPQSINAPPSSASPATTTDSNQDDNQTSSAQAHPSATHVSLGTPLGMASTSAAAPGSSAVRSPQSEPALTDLGHREGQHPANSTVASSQSASVRLPVPTGHSLYPRTPRHRLSSGRTSLSDELRGESSRAATDGSGPSTSSSDDDSDLELGPRLHFMGYQHSTRQSQILRGQMSNKRVASKKAIQSLQEVDITTLSESEKSKLTNHPPYFWTP